MVKDIEMELFSCKDHKTFDFFAVTKGSRWYVLSTSIVGILSITWQYVMIKQRENESVVDCYTIQILKWNESSSFKGIFG